jgi:tetratricopeptide (TPR) repeat protein
VVKRAADRIGDPNLLADVEQVIGNIEWVKKGNHEKARHHYSAALEAYQSAGNDIKAAITVNNIATIDRQQGDTGAAEEKLKNALPVLEDSGLYHYLRYTLSNLGELCLSAGRYPEALTYFENVKNTALCRFDYPFLACAFVGIAESYFGMGDRTLAEQCAWEAVDVARRFGDSVEMGMAHRVLGEIAAAGGDHGKAIEFFESAERILSGLEEIEEAAKVQADLHKLHGTGGEQ